jgi:CspA family cold shock protein
MAVAPSGRPFNDIPQPATNVARQPRAAPRMNARQERAMAIGTVKFFNTTKGYGFIQPEDGSKDVFVHVSAVQAAGMQTLREGQRVSFDVTTERGKPAAANLKPA